MGKVSAGLADGRKSVLYGLLNGCFGFWPMEERRCDGCAARGKAALRRIACVGGLRNLVDK